MVGGMKNMTLVALMTTIVAAGAAEYRIYVGTYTAKGSKTEGVGLLTFDDVTGVLKSGGTAAVSDSPSFVTVSSDGKFVYAVNEGPSAATAFAVDGATGKLKQLSQVPVGEKGAQGPCHLCLVESDGILVTANYGGGSVSTFAVGEDGGLESRTGFIQHVGSGPDKGRQESPHAHGAVLAPDGKHVLVNDLGTDRVYIYAVDSFGKKLAEKPIGEGVINPGAGPRHGAFSPDGKMFYCLNEMACTVTPMAWDGEAKTLTAGKPVRTLEGEHKGNSTAEIAVHPGGKWVFASNRGHDSIAVFAAEGGAVALKGTVPCGGAVPRSFTLSPDGKWLLAAHQESNSVQVFSFDAASGELKAKGGPVKTTCGKPVSLVFAPKTEKK